MVELAHKNLKTANTIIVNIVNDLKEDIMRREMNDIFKRHNGIFRDGKENV